MSDITINSLPTASTIDGSADILPIYTASALATQGINRNTLLNLSSQPLGLTDTQSPTNKTFNNTNAFTIKDGSLTLQNTASTTKQAVFSLSGITAGQTRTITLPDYNATMASLAGTETFTNKTLTSPTINSPTITNAIISTDSLTGFTVSNNGTVYGISVTSGTIGSAALAANSVLTAAISDNNVTASKLSTSAIKLGSTTTTANFSTSSGTAVQITNLTSTVTIPSGGRGTKITVYLPNVGNATANSINTVTLWDGVVGSGTQIASGVSVNVAANQTVGECMTLVCFVSPSAGSKTYNVGLAASAGTVQTNASATSPNLILVEAV